MRYLILVAAIALCFTRVKNNKIIFTLTMVLYAAFLALRCGQGLDYFSYGHSYIKAQPSLFEILFEGAWAVGVDFDPGYNILVSIFKQFGAPYEVFIAALSIAMVVLMYRFIIRYSKNYMLSFAVLYASYGIVLLESALRQGIATILLITLAIPFLEDRKYIRAALVMLIAVTFHTSSVVFILVLIVFYIEPLYEKIVKNWLKLIVLVAIPVILLFNIVGIDRLMTMLPLPESILSRVSFYLAESTGYSIVAIGYRLVMLVIVLLALKVCNTEKHTRKLLYVMAIGYLLYFAVAQFPLLSRVTMYFEFLEVVLIPALVGGQWRYKFMSSASKNRLVGIGVSFYLVILSMLFYSEMNFTLQAGAYRDTSYIPYISVLERDNLEEYFDREQSLYVNEYLALKEELDEELDEKSE